jgi:hypothetical protein
MVFFITKFGSSHHAFSEVFSRSIPAKLCLSAIPMFSVFFDGFETPSAFGNGFRLLLSRETLITVHDGFYFFLQRHRWSVLKNNNPKM